MKKLLFLLYAPLLFFCACKKKDQGTALKGVWARKADFPGVKRQAAVGFSIGGTGYIGTGYDGAIGLSDLYAYDPVSDSWTQRASLPVSPSLSRYGSVAFVIDGKAYLVGGNSATGFLKEVWEYDPANDMWTNKNPFPGPARGNGIGLSVGSFGYFGLGYSIAPLAQLTDWWKYDPSTDQWTQMLDFPGPNIQSGMGFGL
ncbi:MAG TPA: kelch repeat-containing protein, partial [Puia sp.]